MFLSLCGKPDSIRISAADDGNRWCVVVVVLVLVLVVVVVACVALQQQCDVPLHFAEPAVEGNPLLSSGAECCGLLSVTTRRKKKRPSALIQSDVGVRVFLCSLGG